MNHQNYSQGNSNHNNHHNNNTYCDKNGTNRKKTRILAVETPKNVARTPVVAQTVAPVLVVDVETTNNSGSLGLGCSGLCGLAHLLHILPTKIGLDPLSVLDHHSLASWTEASAGNLQCKCTQRN